MRGCIVAAHLGNVPVADDIGRRTSCDCFPVHHDDQAITLLGFFHVVGGHEHSGPARWRRAGFLPTAARC